MLNQADRTRAEFRENDTFPLKPSQNLTANQWRLSKSKDILKKSTREQSVAYASGTPKSLKASLSRSPKRLTITIPFTVFSALEKRSTEEGRSLSNLAAYLLEQSLNPQARESQ